MAESRPVSVARALPDIPPAQRGAVEYAGVRNGRAQWSFSGDVAPAWFRRSGARFVVTDGRLTLNGSEVAVGTVFTSGSL